MGTLSTLFYAIYIAVTVGSTDVATNAETENTATQTEQAQTSDEGIRRELQDIGS